MKLKIEQSSDGMDFIVVDEDNGENRFHFEYGESVEDLKNILNLFGVDAEYKEVY